MKTRHASIWVSLTVVLLFIPPAGAHEKTVVGWLEKVWIDPGDVLVHAKLDTGARHSSLNAPEIMEFDRNGEKWVRFTVRSQDGKKVTLERKIHRIATVKRKGASSQKRPVVMLGICLGNYFKEVEVNLVDRSSFLYQMLIGRSFMKDALIIDPSVKYTTRPHCTEGTKP